MVRRAAQKADPGRRHETAPAVCVADLNDAGMGVKFVRACSDKITELMEFRDNACPYFVFYMARGQPNAPSTPSHA